jgi:hypothetical protein
MPGFIRKTYSKTAEKYLAQQDDKLGPIDSGDQTPREPRIAHVGEIEPSRPPMYEHPPRLMYEPPTAPAPVIADDGTIEWLEKHGLSTELHSARAGGSLDRFVDFLTKARRRLPDELEFTAWLEKRGIELAANVSLEERALLAVFRARRNAPNKMSHAK